MTSTTVLPRLAQAALPRLLHSVMPTRMPDRGRRIVIAVYIGVNIALTLTLVSPMMGPDWEIWQSLATPNPYATDPRWVWSPAAVPLMQAAVAIGFWPFAALHLAGILLLRSPLLILLTLSSWAFWTDVATGNTFTFVFVAAVLALRGSRGGILTSFVLMLLMPRPIQLPLLVWVMWSHRDLWRWYAGLFLTHFAIVLASGLALEWLSTMVAFGGAPEYDIGPTAWLGSAWLLVGMPVAASLLILGRPGWAGLALTPYTLPQYLLLPLCDHVTREHVHLAAGRGRSKNQRNRSLPVSIGANPFHAP